MKVAEIRLLNSEELKKKLDDSYRELFNLRFRVATKQSLNSNEVRNVKRRIARIKTIMRERQI